VESSLAARLLAPFAALVSLGAPLVVACSAAPVASSPAAPVLSTPVARFAPPAVSGRVSWTRTFGDDAQQSLLALGVDDQGTALVGGGYLVSLPVMDPPLHSDKGVRRPWLAAIEPDGTPRWVKQPGGPQSEGTVQHLAAIADGSMLIAGTFEHAKMPLITDKKQVVIGRLDREGEPVWALGLGTDPDLIELHADPQGGGLVVGRFRRLLTLGETVLAPLSAHAYTGLVLRLGEGGQPRWARGYGGEKGCALLASALLPGGDVVLGGVFEGAADLGEGPVESAGKGDALLVRLDGDGKPRWTRHWGAAKASSVNLVAAGPREEAWLVGAAAEGLDLGGGALGRPGVFLAHLGPAGEHLGSWLLAAVSVEGLAVDREGRPVLVGWVTGEAEIGGRTTTGKADQPELFVALLDVQGKTLEFERFPRGRGHSVKIALAPRGDLLLGASLTSSFRLRGRQVEHHGSLQDDDIFLARFTP
jgi:hypothetical protein